MRGLLRSRGLDADLRAARFSGGHEPVAGVVALAHRRAIPWYRRPFAYHPDPAERLAVLEQPDRAAPVSLLDGFAAAFLAALTAPLGVSLLIAGTVGVTPPSLAPVAIALVAGPLLGFGGPSALARVDGWASDGSRRLTMACGARCGTFALVTCRRGALTPQWILERGEPAPWPAESPRLMTVAATAILAGLVGAAIIGFRILADPASSDAQILQRFIDYIWLAAAIGVATTLVFALLRPRYGLGLGVPAGALAAPTIMVGYLAINVALGADLTGKFVSDSVLPSIVIGFFLAVIVAPATFFVRSMRPFVRKLWVVAAPVALVAGLTVIGASEVTTLFAADAIDGQFSPAAEARSYVGVVAPDIVQQYGAVEQTKATIDEDRLADDATRAARIRSEVIAPVRAQLDDAQSYQPPTPEIERVHASALAALRTMLESFALSALVYETGDAELLAEAEAKRAEGFRSWQEWASGVTELAAQ